MRMSLQLCIDIDIDIYNQQCRLSRFAIPEHLAHSHWIWPLVKHSAVIPELFWCSWWPLYSQPQFTSTSTSTISFNLRVSVRVTGGMFCSKNYAFSSCLILPTMVDTIHNTAGRDMTSTMRWRLEISTLTCLHIKASWICLPTYNNIYNINHSEHRQ